MIDERQFARWILETQKIREESWDIKNEKYTKNILEATIATRVPEKWIQVVYLLNLLAWSDIQDWAIKNA